MWVAYEDFIVKVKLYRTGEDQKKQSDDPTLGLNDERMEAIRKEVIEAINTHLKQYHEEDICSDYSSEEISDAYIVFAPEATEPIFIQIQRNAFFRFSETLIKMFDIDPEYTDNIAQALDDLIRSKGKKIETVDKLLGVTITMTKTT